MSETGSNALGKGSSGSRPSTSSTMGANSKSSSGNGSGGVMLASNAGSNSQQVMMLNQGSQVIIVPSHLASGASNLQTLVQNAISNNQLVNGSQGLHIYSNPTSSSASSITSKHLVKNATAIQNAIADSQPQHTAKSVANSQRSTYSNSQLMSGSSSSNVGQSGSSSRMVVGGSGTQRLYVSGGTSGTSGGGGGTQLTLQDMVKIATRSAGGSSTAPTIQVAPNGRFTTSGNSGVSRSTQGSQQIVLLNTQQVGNSNVDLKSSMISQSSSHSHKPGIIRRKPNNASSHAASSNHASSTSSNKVTVSPEALSALASMINNVHNNTHKSKTSSSSSHRGKMISTSGSGMTLDSLPPGFVQNSNTIIRMVTSGKSGKSNKSADPHSSSVYSMQDSSSSSGKMQYVVSDGKSYMMQSGSGGSSSSRYAKSGQSQMSPGNKRGGGSAYGRGASSTASGSSTVASNAHVQHRLSKQDILSAQREPQNASKSGGLLTTHTAKQVLGKSSTPSTVHDKSGQYAKSGSHVRPYTPASQLSQVRPKKRDRRKPDHGRPRHQPRQERPQAPSQPLVDRRLVGHAKSQKKTSYTTGTPMVTSQASHTPKAPNQSTNSSRNADYQTTNSMRTVNVVPQRVNSSQMATKIFTKNGHVIDLDSLLASGGRDLTEAAKEAILRQIAADAQPALTSQKPVTSVSPKLAGVSTGEKRRRSVAMGTQNVSPMMLSNKMKPSSSNLTTSSHKTSTADHLPEYNTMTKIQQALLAEALPKQREQIASAQSSQNTMRYAMPCTSQSTVPPVVPKRLRMSSGSSAVSVAPTVKTEAVEESMPPPPKVPVVVEPVMSCLKVEVKEEVVVPAVEVVPRKVTPKIPERPLTPEVVIKKPRHDSGDAPKTPKHSHKRFRQSHFQTRYDMKVKVKQGSPLYNLENEIATSAPILDNAVKRINFVRSLMLTPCKNLHLTYTRLERLRELISEKAPSLSTELTSELTKSIETHRAGCLETQADLTLTTCPAAAKPTPKPNAEKGSRKSPTNQQRHSMTTRSELLPAPPHRNQHRGANDAPGQLLRFKAQSLASSSGKTTMPAPSAPPPIIRSTRLANRRNAEYARHAALEAAHEEACKPSIPMIIMPQPPEHLDDYPVDEVLPVNVKRQLDDKACFPTEAKRQLIDTLDILSSQYKVSCAALMDATGNIVIEGYHSEQSTSALKTLSTLSNCASYVYCKKGTERKSHKWGATSALAPLHPLGNATLAQLGREPKQSTLDTVLCKSVVQRLERENLTYLDNLTQLTKEAVSKDAARRKRETINHYPGRRKSTLSSFEKGECSSSSGGSGGKSSALALKEKHVKTGGGGRKKKKS